MFDFCIVIVLVWILMVLLGIWFTLDTKLPNSPSKSPEVQDAPERMPEA